MFFWVLGRTAARQIPEEGKGLSFTRQVVEPLVTSIVLVIGQLFGRRVRPPARAFQ